MEKFALLDNVEVVAFVRRNRDALDEMRRKWDVPQGYTDHREMLEKADIDAVDIITPTDSHRPIALDAIAAGKHVLCDKPLALTAPDCREMLDAAESAGVIHSTNFNQRGNTAVGKMKRYIDDGFIGRFFHANISWGMSLQHDVRPEALSWRFTRARGGGTVYELIHAFDMVRFLNGEVARICALLNTAEPRRRFMDVDGEATADAPDSSAFLLEFVDGGYAVIHTSFVSRGLDPDGRTHAMVEVAGSHGKIATYGRYGLTGRTGPNGPMGELEPGPEYAQPYERFVDACLAGDQSLVETSFYDGMKAAELVDAAYLSWDEKRWVDLV